MALTVQISGTKQLEKLRWLVNLDSMCASRGITYATPYEAARKFLDYQGFSARTLNKLIVTLKENQAND